MLRLKVTLLLLCFTLGALSSTQNGKTHRFRREVDDGQYHPTGDEGQYHPDDSGKYVHQEVKYVHQQIDPLKYVHVQDKAVPYIHVPDKTVPYVHDVHKHVDYDTGYARIDKDKQYGYQDGGKYSYADTLDKYTQGGKGVYVQTGSRGQYEGSGSAGRYAQDNSGAYVHDESGNYAHKDNKYVHTEGSQGAFGIGNTASFASIGSSLEGEIKKYLADQKSLTGGKGSGTYSYGSIYASGAYGNSGNLAGINSGLEGDIKKYTFDQKSLTGGKGSGALSYGTKYASGAYGVGNSGSYGSIDNGLEGDIKKYTFDHTSLTGGKGSGAFTYGTTSASGAYGVGSFSGIGSGLEGDIKKYSFDQKGLTSGKGSGAFSYGANTASGAYGVGGFSGVDSGLEGDIKKYSFDQKSLTSGQGSGALLYGNKYASGINGKLELGSSVGAAVLPTFYQTGGKGGAGFASGYETQYGSNKNVFETRTSGLDNSATFGTRFGSTGATQINTITPVVTSDIPTFYSSDAKSTNVGSASRFGVKYGYGNAIPNSKSIAFGTAGVTGGNTLVSGSGKYAYTDSGKYVHDESGKYANTGAGYGSSSTGGVQKYVINVNSDDSKGGLSVFGIGKTQPITTFGKTVSTVGQLDTGIPSFAVQDSKTTFTGVGGAGKITTSGAKSAYNTQAFLTGQVSTGADGKYAEDNSGQYVHDDSGSYTHVNGGSTTGVKTIGIPSKVVYGTGAVTTSRFGGSDSFSKGSTGQLSQSGAFSFDASKHSSTSGQQYTTSGASGSTYNKGFDVNSVSGIAPFDVTVSGQKTVSGKVETFVQPQTVTYTTTRFTQPNTNFGHFGAASGSKASEAFKIDTQTGEGGSAVVIPTFYQSQTGGFGGSSFVGQSKAKSANSYSSGGYQAATDYYTGGAGGNVKIGEGSQTGAYKTYEYKVTGSETPVISRFTSNFGLDKTVTDFGSALLTHDVCSNSQWQNHKQICIRLKSACLTNANSACNDKDSFCNTMVSSIMSVLFELNALK